MRLLPVIALAVSLASVFALSERQASFPSCSVLCFTDPDTGSCSSTDVACLCNNENYLRSTTNCVQKQCTAEDVATAARAAQQLCLAAGIDITTNPAAQPTNASGSAVQPISTSGSASGTDAAASAATATTSLAAASATTTHNAAIAGSVTEKSLMVGGFVAVAAVLAL